MTPWFIVAGLLVAVFLVWSRAAWDDEP